MRGGRGVGSDVSSPEAGKAGRAGRWRLRRNGSLDTQSFRRPPRSAPIFADGKTEAQEVTGLACVLGK